MIFSFPDYLVIVLFLLSTMYLVHQNRHENGSVSEYFAADGKLGWFVAGTAMAATTFAADTPLAVTELVAKFGISGNWLWWYGSLGSILTVYLFAPLWKKSGVMTDIELIHIRYSGHGVEMLRKFKAVYMGLVMNAIILAWVNLAMLKISQTIFPNISGHLLVTVLFGFALFYTIVTGLSGISRIDVYQFFLAMTGCIVLAWFAVHNEKIHGMDHLVSSLDKSYFHFIPDFHQTGGTDLSFSSFVILLTITWWASWYPGAEPGGGGYIAQRILASKNEKSAVYASLLFVILHYFIRPWPWIIAGLASVVLFHLPETERGKGFVMLLEYTPAGVKGLMLVSFIAAYLSTIATHLNWGASYLINDLVRPYWRPNKTDTYYLTMTRFIQGVFMILSLLICFFLIDTVSGTWIFLLQASSGIGFVLVMRWFWWRINVWSEIAAIFLPPIFYMIARFGLQLEFTDTFLFTVIESILAIVSITYITPQTEKSILASFYQKVQPPGTLWRSWAKTHLHSTYTEKSSTLKIVFLLVFAGVAMLFSGLFLVGNILLGQYTNSGMYLLILVVSIYITASYIPKLFLSETKM